MNNGTVYIEFFYVKFVIELGREANLFSTIKNITILSNIVKSKHVQWLVIRSVHILKLNISTADIHNTLSLCSVPEIKTPKHNF